MVQNVYKKNLYLSEIHRIEAMKKIYLLVFTLLLMTAAIAQQKSDSLIVFVGKKIEVKEWPEEPVKTITDTATTAEGIVYTTSVVLPMDARYRATYEILELIHGSYERDTIEFTVFDHYGVPAFSEYENVLLFVANENGKLYHEKYQYFDLYKTTNGKWASPYHSSEYNHPYKDSITVKPEKISFEKDAWYATGKMNKKSIYFRYPSKYYAFKANKAIPLYGNYVKDLFKLKQQTILKARGYF